MLEVPMKILFVCSGNTCRSPLAEALARKAAREEGPDGLEVRSAGTSALFGEPASDGARRVARRHGLDLEGHSSTPLDEDLVAWADLVLTMGSTHLRRVLELGGEGKSALLGAFGQDRKPSGRAGPGLEVPDPFGGDDEAYEQTFRRVEQYVVAALGALAKEGNE